MSNARLWARTPWLRFALPIAAAAIVIALIAGSSLGSDDDIDRASAGEADADAQRDSSGAVDGSTDSATSQSEADDDAAGDASQPIRVATEESPLYDARPEEIPLDAEVTNTSDLGDGDAVAIRVVPQAGSQVFGFTAFLCRGDVDIKLDAQVRPTNFGYCISRPLSSKSDSVIEVAASPPYEAVEGSFRVGVGSDTFQLRDGRSATVTCDAAHPCQLVLKLQFPYGYGFQSFPITFR